MRTAHPELLWLLWTLPFLAITLWWARGWAERRLRRFISEPMLEEMAASVSPGRRIWRSALRIGALGLLVLAAARPQWGASEVEVEQTGIDLVVALDVSRSMLADDIEPSRLARAKAEIGELVESLDGDRVGLVFFAGAAFVDLEKFAAPFGQREEQGERKCAEHDPDGGFVAEQVDA